MKPTATISIDVDPLEAHLAGYGVEKAPRDGLVYDRSVPRLRRLLGEAGIRATFFVVAQDAEARAPLLRELVADGHELASHSWSHPARFEGLSPDRMAEEIRLSREGLAAAGGADVVGFRAPGWGWPRGMTRALDEAGYRYDASSFPSPLLGAMRCLLWLKGLERGDWTLPHLEVARWLERRLPHPLGPGALQEFPVTVTRALRVPVYHTLRYAMGERRFERTLDRLLGEGAPLSYPLHAVDVLGYAEDGVDPRLAAHPGMARGLDEKLDLLRATLAAITARFEVKTFAERLQSPAGSERGSDAQS